MSKPTTRPEFKLWCLRKLGFPVVNINVDNGQVEDRIDEAIAYYRDYHHLASERVFLKHVLTAEDIANKYVTVPDHVTSITKIMDPGMQMGSGGSLTNVRYQFMMSEVFNLASGSTIPTTSYFMAMRHIESINYVFGPQFSFRFNKHSGICYIDTDWSQRAVGEVMVFDTYRALDPRVIKDMWNDWWLQRYTVALIEQQWGRNLSPFAQVTLLGGVQLDGQGLLSRAEETLRKLEEEVVQKFSLPPIPRIA